MKKLLALVWMLVLLVSTATAAPDHAEDVARAQQAALDWLRLLDAGRYGESWDAASSYWKADYTREHTARVLQELRAPLGRLASRKIRRSEFLVVPDGDCVHIVFDSVFANKPEHAETLDMQRETSGEWKVSLWGQRARYRDD
ncbi:DUF4019 domain-containing protein [Massilia sp. Dwa41.01b]|uniref:DUF4019 domain-containing protein n=1 Tax=unclassified Massilia TaxID=2609279 RepID=UPI0016008730|nr:MULTISPECIES: DUF4019 domain-containing protein [unclassified Massilia]QNA88730.1 DUF4019 domain-containing protein [Massilia sp. Dwa41.01b]QNA99628.1 DUF4019 domain-containing protein [Massilia sp. Se16.2.3]